MEPLLIVFGCSCGISLKVNDELAGRLVRCPSCNQTARAPQGSLSSTPGPADSVTGAGPSGQFITEATPTTENHRSPFWASSDETVAPPRRVRAPVSEMTAFLAPAQEEDELGRLGSYRILRVLGQGGMGVVFQAEDAQLRRQVAIKAMLPHLAANSSARERFLREACLAAALDHDHIVAIHHIGEDRDVPYIVMPLLKGESLDNRLKGGGPIPPALILQVGLEVADALATAHDHGLLHRDIKPANIWLEDRVGGTGQEPGIRGLTQDSRFLTPVRVKLLDFGLARLTAVGAKEQLTLSGAVLGTPGYMPPEQVDGEELDGRSDLFSLGCILYSLATGQPAFPGDSVSQRLKSVILFDPPQPHRINPEIPPELSSLILQMLAKKKEDRPASAAEVLSRLRQIKTGLDNAQARSGIVCPKPVNVRPPFAFGRRQGLLLVGGILGMAAFAILVELLLTRGNPDPVARTGPSPRENKQAGWMGWPLDAPPPAVAPFDAEQARQHQEAWATFSGVPVEWTNSLGMKFRLIPPGEFLMGSPRQEIDDAIAMSPNLQSWHANFRSEGPQHRVILSTPFYLGVYEVSQKEFQQVMAANPSSFSATGRRKEAVAGHDTGRHPVDSVDWLESVAFTVKLSDKEKLKARYFRAGGTVTLLQGNGYRLPTEAEWEFASRAGPATRFWFGDKDQHLNQVAWFRENSGDRHPVGELRDNPFGLYDMYGNVWEWCQDWFDAAYYQSLPNPAIDPLGPSGGSDRVLRGGGWTVMAPYCRSGARHPSVPFSNGLEPGFRVMLSVDTVRSLLKKSPKKTNLPSAN
jgi:serine/threonine protein kinase